MNHEQLTKELLSIIPSEETARVFNQKMCDIDPTFIGFLDIYKALSEVIPKHWTIVDLGCAYNPQSYYFTEHKKYLAVDLPREGMERWCPDNCIIYEMNIMQFIEHVDKLKLEETFVICNYVPAWGNLDKELVRKTFPNLYMYYPHRDMLSDFLISVGEALKDCK